MTDSRLRDLERRYSQSGAKDDRDAFDAERVRAGVAVETGFLQRLEFARRDYRSRACIYTASGARAVNLSPLLQGEDLIQVQYVPERIYFLTTGRHANALRFNLHIVNQAGTVAKVLRVRSPTDDANFIATDVVCVGDSLGSIVDTGVDSRLYVDNTLQFQVDNAQIFDRSAKEGCLFYGRADDADWVVRSESEGIVARWHGPYRWMRSIYVQDGRLTGGVINSTVRDRQRSHLNDLAALQIPSESRLAQKRFVAGVTEELERYHVLCGLSPKRIIVEMPRKNLEGLLIAVERASHRRVKK